MRHCLAILDQPTTCFDFPAKFLLGDKQILLTTGKIIQEFTQIFTGAGWNVIKILWGSSWDSLFEKDVNGKLRQRLLEMNDGQLQFARAHGKNDFRQSIFGGDPELEAMGKEYSDEGIEQLMRGGHDPAKVFAGYQKKQLITIMVNRRLFWRWRLKVMD